MSRKRMSDVTLEKDVIGSAMRYVDSFKKVSAIIRKPEVFHQFPNQCVWRALVKMSQDGLPFEALNVHETLRKLKLADDVQTAYLVELWGNAPATDVAHHAKTLLDLYLKREALERLRELAEEMKDDDASPVAVMAKIKVECERVAALSYVSEDEETDDKKKFQPFPLFHLPETLQNFVNAGAEALQCDPSFLAVPALVSIGAAIGNSRTMVLKETWHEPAVFWAAIIADSSSLKSPSMQLATAPLWAIQKGMSLEFENECSTWQADVEHWRSKRYAKGKRADDDDDGGKPEQPKARALIVNDITIEKLAHTMWENPQGLVLVRDELSGWFASFGRYSDGKGPGADMANWLEIFRAHHLRIDRKTGVPPTIFIPRAACSVVGTIQPRVFKRILTEDFFDSGLVSRLLLCMPPRKGKAWSDAIMHGDTYDAYARTIKTIYESGEDIRLRYGGEPKGVQFSRAGKNTWIEFYDEWADRQTHAEGEHAYALSKLEAYCARFCLALAVYDKAESPYRKEEVGEGHVHRAFQIVQWFANEAERVYSMCREPAEKINREKLVEFIYALKGKISARRLLRSNPSKYKTAEAATKVLEGLVENGLGRWAVELKEGQPGRPERVFQLSPDTINA